MKLSAILKHIPARQYCRLTSNMNIIAIGYPTSKDIIQHENSTVGLIEVQDGVLVINTDRKTSE
jgi:hypothetical protein